MEKIRTIQQAAKEYPQLAGIWKNVGSDKMNDKGYNEVKQFQRIRLDEQIALKNLNPILNGSNFKLERGDMREFCKNFDDNSIDMIFTDPPYEAKYLYLYDEVAQLAFRALKPGKSMAIILPNGGPEYEYAFDHIRKAGMTFNHYITLLHEGGSE